MFNGHWILVGYKVLMFYSCSWESTEALIYRRSVHCQSLYNSELVTIQLKMDKNYCTFWHMMSSENKRFIPFTAVVYFLHLQYVDYEVFFSAILSSVRFIALWIQDSDFLFAYGTFSARFLFL